MKKIGVSKREEGLIMRWNKKEREERGRERHIEKETEKGRGGERERGK